MQSGWVVLINVRENKLIWLSIKQNNHQVGDEWHQVAFSLSINCWGDCIFVLYLVCVCVRVHVHVHVLTRQSLSCSWLTASQWRSVASWHSVAKRSLVSANMLNSVFRKDNREHQPKFMECSASKLIQTAARCDTIQIKK